MLTKDYFYHLPIEKIARYPTPNRADSRLLVVGDHGFLDKQFIDIVDLLHPGDLLVLNDSKVIPARLFGHKDTGGKVEVLVERIIAPTQCWAHVRSSKPARSILFANLVTANVINKQNGLFLLEFNQKIMQVLNTQGNIPLPPYMDRSAEASDVDRYQTVYAVAPGSVAAPTAGLHFTDQILHKIKAKGVDIAKVTLHVGAGTFQPVRVANITEHKMHHEYIEVGSEICDKILRTKQSGGRVICVGTTSVRALESAALNGDLQPYYGTTDIFIYPGFKFKVVDCLITNFHLPESSLLMLVSALAGKDKIMAAYEHAIADDYRFYSYGDAMFLSKAK